MPDKIFKDELTSILAHYPNIKIAILFGSFVHGKETPESDIDLGVAANKVLTNQEKIEIISSIAQTFARPVDLIDLQLKQQPILTQILTTGCKLFCKDNNLYAELIKTMWFDQADFMPYRNRILKERRDAWINN